MTFLLTHTPGENIGTQGKTVYKISHLRFSSVGALNVGLDKDIVKCVSFDFKIKKI